MSFLKSFSLLLVVALIAVSASASAFDAPSGLPKLNTIFTHVFDTAYSCGGDYAKSGLALDGDVQSPDLLFNGACGSDPSFQASFAGEDFSLLSLIGDSQTHPLHNVSAHAAFNYANMVGQDNIFKQDIMSQSGNTYSVLRTQGGGGGLSTRTLFAFETVSGCDTANRPCKIAYAVLNYGKVKFEEESPGFDWTKLNSPQ
jgi:hypothetical protein